MPECNNCGSMVTERYVAVFAPTGYDTVRCCPYCEDKIRERGNVREAKSNRRGGNSKRTDQPDYARTAARSGSDG